MDLRRLFGSAGKIFVSDFCGETAFVHELGVPKALYPHGFANIGDNGSSWRDVLVGEKDFRVFFSRGKPCFSEPHANADIESNVSSVLQSMNVDNHGHVSSFNRNVPRKSHEVANKITETFILDVPYVRPIVRIPRQRVEVANVGISGFGQRIAWFDEFGVRNGARAQCSRERFGDFDGKKVVGAVGRDDDERRIPPNFPSIPGFFHVRILPLPTIPVQF